MKRPILYSHFLPWFPSPCPAKQLWLSRMLNLNYSPKFEVELSYRWMFAIESFMLPYPLKSYVQGVTSKPHPRLKKKTFSHKPAAVSENCQSDSLLENEFLCLEYVGRRAWMESARNESIKKRSILSNKKLILQATFHKGIGESRLLLSASWKKLKTLSRLFHSNVPFTPMRADSFRSDPLSRFHPIFPSISPSERPPISPTKEVQIKSPTHGVRNQVEAWKKERQEKNE